MERKNVAIVIAKHRTLRSVFQIRGVSQKDSKEKRIQERTLEDRIRRTRRVERRVQNQRVPQGSRSRELKVELGKRHMQKKKNPSERGFRKMQQVRYTDERVRERGKN